MSSTPLFRIRRAALDDIDAVGAVLARAFEPYQPLYSEAAYAATTVRGEALRSRMREGPVWVALRGEEIVATAGAIHQETGLYVRGMATLPTVRRLGIGRQLLEHIERFARAGGYARVFLRTTPFLQAAIRLYESFGFHVVPEPAPAFFGTPLITMEKRLGE